jgi:hypothetical protein
MPPNDVPLPIFPTFIGFVKKFFGPIITCFSTGSLKFFLGAGPYGIYSKGALIPNEEASLPFIPFNFFVGTNIFS